VNDLAWRSSTRLFEMLPIAAEHVDDRKRRLFAVACCRRLAHLFEDDRSRRAVDVAELYADGLAFEEERLFAENNAFEAHFDVRESRLSAMPLVRWTRSNELITQAALLAVSVGTFYAEDAADYGRLALAASGVSWRIDEDEELAQCRLLREIVGPLYPPAIDPPWLSANDRAVVQLAQLIYDSRTFDELPILADALEDAGCSETDILEHCRQTGGHVRGCWVVDLLLAKT
jgi:hypothetical protein